MTVIELDVTELTVEDPGIPCTMENCSASATRIVKIGCGCVHFWCLPCLSDRIADLKRNLPCGEVCDRDPNWFRMIYKISDHLVRVDPL